MQARAVLLDEEVVKAVAALFDGYVVGNDIEHGLDQGQGLVRLRLEGQKRRAEARRVRAFHRGWVRKKRVTLNEKQKQQQQRTRTRTSEMK